MKSSSELFPVSLHKVEILGDLTEDVYLIKHNKDADKSVQIALSHISKHGEQGKKGAVVMVHGSFSNRGFWITRKGLGLARYLVDLGFDVWLMEHRGHGLSPRNHDYRKNTLERYVLHDVPAVNDFVQEKTGQLPFWLGHSFGGIMINTACAAGVLTPDNCAGMVTFGTQIIRRPPYLWLPLSSTLVRMSINLRGELDGRKLKIGPENEPASLVNEYLARHSYFGSWQFKSTQQKLMPAWKEGSGIPLLSFAAAADKTDPAKYCMRFASLYGGSDKEIVLLGKNKGYSQDYDHVNMVVSKNAAKEVWPQVGEWLLKHCR